MGFRFMEKLKGLKIWLSTWNREVFELVHDKKKEIMRKIADIDEVNDEGNISVGQKEERAKLKVDLVEVVTNELSLVRQKAKIMWLKDEDENSDFFHWLLSGKKNRQFIATLNSRTRNLLTTENEIEEEIVRVFNELYTKDSNPRFTIESIGWGTLDSQSSNILERPFTEQEIQRAIRNCGNLKSPGPDSVTSEFYKNSWNILKIFLMCSRSFFRTISLIGAPTKLIFASFLRRKELILLLNSGLSA